mmetsp:Transcript_14897/g.45526  ORF Transcript_14897/g.45526 Transcript_14897/m.45526 type:complete len:337 (-) Transcript_14897:1005-2015(-)
MIGSQRGRRAARTRPAPRGHCGGSATSGQQDLLSPTLACHDTEALGLRGRTRPHAQRPHGGWLPHTLSAARPAGGRRGHELWAREASRWQRARSECADPVRTRSEDHGPERALLRRARGRGLVREGECRARLLVGRGPHLQGLALGGHPHRHARRAAGCTRRRCPGARGGCTVAAIIRRGRRRQEGGGDEAAAVDGHTEDTWAGSRQGRARGEVGPRSERRRRARRGRGAGLEAAQQQAVRAAVHQDAPAHIRRGRQASARAHGHGDHGAFVPVEERERGPLQRSGQRLCGVESEHVRAPTAAGSSRARATTKALRRPAAAPARKCPERGHAVSAR